MSFDKWIFREGYSELSEHYVYVIFRITGEPCYVGKGKGRRWKKHFTEAGCANDHLRRIIKQHGSSLPVVKVREGLTNDEAIATEIAFIAALGREQDGSGPLVNFTLGGDGANGYVHTPERIEKIRQTHIGKKKSELHRKKLSEFRKEFRYTEEQKLALSNGHFAQWAKPGAREALSEKTKGRPVSEETKAKMRTGWLTRAPASEESRAKMRASSALRWARYKAQRASA